MDVLETPNSEPAGFFKRKTTWAALASIFGGIAGAVTGTVDYATAAGMVLNALMALGIRSAIANK